MTSQAASGGLRVAAIGVGHLGRHHARILSTLPGVTYVGAADLVADRARAAVDGTSGRAFADYRALFGLVDAVSVAVPTVDHVAVAREFLEHGVHVLVEKPMASSVEDAGALVRTADEAGVVLAVGHSERFNPAVQAALAVVHEPRFIEVHRLSSFPERSLDIDVVFDVMIHDLDIISAMDRSDVVEVEAVGVPVLTPRVDIANARVKFSSGCIANLTASRISREQVRKVRCFQRDMYVSVDYAEQELEVWRLQPKTGERPAIEGGKVPVVRDEPLRRELADFVGAVVERRPPLVSGRDGLRALVLATRVARAIDAEAAQGAASHPPVPRT
jgi:predicted dehydrogenase